MAGALHHVDGSKTFAFILRRLVDLSRTVKML